MKNEYTLLDKSFLDPSPQFKTNVLKVIFSIVVFVLVYLLLMALSLGLLILCTMLGISVICFHFSIITLAAGVGRIGLGVMLVMFMLKFIFSTTRNSDPNRIEITAQDYPDLFSFVNEVAREAGTPFPKKIFISPDVNAAVFYDSSFLSMFLPIKKNLLLGLGMVNSVNKSEFKAILAHEFGHFSQRSMKLGSYVYTTNKVIYNLLYENSGWEAVLNSFAKVHGILFIFAKITYMIANSIKWVLMKVYQWIQLKNMALSREMEYHADLVAVSVAGSSQLTNALRRIEFASTAYDLTTAELNQLAEKNARCKNVFQLQRKVIINLSIANKLSLDHDLPLISDEELEKRKTPSRINIEDQWASHPSRMEREENINRIPVDMAYDSSSPWTFFPNPEGIQEQVTDHMYRIAFPKKLNMQYKSTDEIYQEMESKNKNIALPDMFSGFYEGRIFGEINVASLMAQSSDETFDSIFSSDFKGQVSSLLSAIADRIIIQEIKDKTRSLKSFDFDGQKFRQADAASILTQIESEVGTLRKSINEYDVRAFKFFMTQARNAGSESAYKNMLEFHLVIQEHAYNFSELLRAMNKIHTLLHSKTNWSNAALLNVSEKINVEKEKYEDLLHKAAGISVPEISSMEAINDLRTYLLEEPMAEVYLSSFDYNLFLKLYGQTVVSFSRVNEIWQHSYRNLLLSMETLAAIPIQKQEAFT